MAHSAKAQNQNTRAAALAQRLLVEAGFDALHERTTFDAYGRLGDYTVNIRRAVVGHIAAAIPDYPRLRAEHQVNQAMGGMRGRAERQAEGVLNLQDASLESGIPVPTIRSAMLRGDIPGAQVGGPNTPWRIPCLAFEAWRDNRPPRGPKGKRAQ